MENPRYQLPYEQCILDSNDRILTYSYKAGETIRLTLDNNFKTILNGYEQYPIERFCIGAPARLVSRGEGGSRTTTLIYDELRKKEFMLHISKAIIWLMKTTSPNKFSKPTSIRV